jgi:hypothetical protein
MKNKFYLFLVFLLSYHYISAQRTAVIAISGGVTNYIGDLGNEKYFPYSSINSGSTITIRDFLNDPRKSGTRYSVFDMQVRFSWHRLQYDETDPIGDKKGNDLRNYKRGIGFRNDLIGSEVDFTYNIFPHIFSPLNKQKYSFFFMAGIGAFYGKPKADLFYGNPSPESKYYPWSDGTIRDAAENPYGIGNEIKKDGVYETNLRDWHTEGQGYNGELKQMINYNYVNVGIPMGAGFRYFYNKYLTFSAEFNYYYFFTDYLDDVSNRYATYDELKSNFPDAVNYNLAKYISDPSGLGTSGDIATASKRGNPDQKDSFTYVSLEASYKITWKKKGIYGQ